MLKFKFNFSKFKVHHTNKIVPCLPADLLKNIEMLRFDVCPILFIQNKFVEQSKPQHTVH